MPGMAYDEDLANRIRELIAGDPDVDEKRMFGGLAFLVAGHMAVAASHDGGLMVRVDSEDIQALVSRPHARPFEMRGRALEGWLRVDAEGVRTKRQLEPWVKLGAAYARSLSRRAVSPSSATLRPGRSAGRRPMPPTPGGTARR